MEIMIVEDDNALCQGIALALANGKDTFCQCQNLKEASAQWQKKKPDLLLLDINLPDGSGYDFLKEIRKSSDIPVLILTANDLEMDQVTGFSLGADDYVTKPFSLAVLRARIEALKRRCKNESHTQEPCRIGSFVFDFDKLQFYKGEEELTLSRNEQKLLRLFLENDGRILTREVLMDRLWTDGGEYVDENALSVTVNRLRKKLGEEDTGHSFIQTVYGQGYIWKGKP